MMEIFKQLDFGELAAFVTVVTAAIYLLGLLAVGWPLYRHVTKDAATAQYAVSLISRAEIAGYGLRVYAGYPLISAIVSILILYVYVIAPNTAVFLFLPFTLPATLWLLFPRYTERVLRKYLPTKIVYLYTSYSSWHQQVTPSRAFLLSIPSFAGTGVAYFALLSLGNTLGALAIAALGAYISGVLYALSRSPSLPSVEITGQSTIVGKLLTHSGGFWYLFDQQGALIAIPDSKTDTVRVYGRAQSERAGISGQLESQQTEKTKQAWETYRRIARGVAIGSFAIVGIGLVVIILLVIIQNII